MVGSMALFSLCTYLCGRRFARDAGALADIAGGAGAPVTPLSQTMLFDTFPRRLHRIITSVYGMTVVIGPVIGPVLGGYLSDMYSWRWAFYLLVPVGLISALGLRLSMLPDPPRGRARLDWIGFLSLSAAISCVQLVLSRGQRLDWFEVARNHGWKPPPPLLAFYVFVAHSVTAERPFLNLRLLLDRNYALGLALVGVFGMLNVTPMVLLPPLLQQYRVSRFADRRGAGGARRRRDARVSHRDVHRQARSAHRHEHRLRPAGDLRPVADEHQPRCRHGHR